MPLNPDIILQARTPTPIDLAGALQNAATLRQFASQERRADQRFQQEQEDRAIEAKDRDQRRELTGLQLDQAKRQQTIQAAIERSKQIADETRKSFTMGTAPQTIDRLRQQDPGAADLYQGFYDNQIKRQNDQRAEAVAIARARNYNADDVAALAALDYHPGAVERYIQETDGGSDPAKVRQFVEGVAASLGIPAPKGQEPVKLGPGDILVPPTGGAPIATNPKPETLAPGFNLGPGQTRFDSTGKPIASLPAAPEKDSASRFIWAVPKDGGAAQLMTPEEIRRTGARQADTADMRNKAAGRELAGKSITALEDLSKKIITKIGPGQRVDALKRGVEAVYGTDPEFRVYQDARLSLAGNLAVAQQGARPSDADIQSIWLPMVPDAYRDTAESAAMKWALVRTMSNQERAAVPEPVSTALKSAPAGRHTLSDGSVWMKDAQGVITKVN